MRSGLINPSESRLRVVAAMSVLKVVTGIAPITAMKYRRDPDLAVLFEAATVTSRRSKVVTRANAW